MPPGADEGNSPPNTINLYENNLVSGNFKVFIQKEFDENVRTSISILKVAEQLHKITKGKGINEIKKVGRNRVICDCNEANVANSLVLAEELKKQNLKVFIPNFLISRAAIVKNIDSDFSEERLKNIIDSRQFKIKNIVRLNRRINNNDGDVEYVPTNTIKIFFFGQRIPEYIYIWNARFSCEPFIPATKQCYKCFRFGHLSKQCRSTSDKCFMCGDTGHSKKDCTTTTPTCTNCGEQHESTNKNCPERKRQDNINVVMATHNISYQEASLEFPKTNESANLYAVRTGNRFANLQDENDFPELSKNSQSQQTSIPMYVPPPISRQRNFRNNSEIRRHNRTKRSRQERSCSNEREEENILSLSNNKKSKDESTVSVTDVETILPENTENTHINQTTQAVIHMHNNDLDKIETILRSDSEPEINQMEISYSEKTNQHDTRKPRRSSRKRQT